LKSRRNWDCFWFGRM